MKNQVLIELIIPDIEERYNVFIPINKKIGNIIVLLNKSILELSKGIYSGSNKTSLYDMSTGVKYSVDELVRNTNIRNGSKLILM